MQIELTDDEFYWVSVAIGNSIWHARKVTEADPIDDQLDAGLLIQKYTALQEKFPEPEIGLNNDGS